MDKIILVFEAVGKEGAKIKIKILGEESFLVFCPQGKSAKKTQEKKKNSIQPTSNFFFDFLKKKKRSSGSIE